MHSRTWTTNRRADAHGGGKENRARLLLEVLDAICREIGSKRVGMRLSPVTPFNDLSDDSPQETFDFVIVQLNPLRLAFLDVLQGNGGAPREQWIPFDYNRLRALYEGNLVRNGVPLNPPDYATFYAGEAKGYTDYTLLQD